MLLLSLLSITAVFGCSPMPGWVSSSRDEQAQNSQYIIEGTVTKSEGEFSYTQTLDVSKYYKGSGPCTVKVSGFSDDASCGPGVPRIGDKIVAYACMKENMLQLNRYNIHAGYALNRNDDVAEWPYHDAPKNCNDKQVPLSNAPCRNNRDCSDAKHRSKNDMQEACERMFDPDFCASRCGSRFNKKKEKCILKKVKCKKITDECACTQVPGCKPKVAGKTKKFKKCSGKPSF